MGAQPELLMKSAAMRQSRKWFWKHDNNKSPSRDTFERATEEGVVPIEVGAFTNDVYTELEGGYLKKQRCRVAA